jgi:hypothetical protein
VSEVSNGNGEGKIAQALLKQFEEHHDKLCDSVQKSVGLQIQNMEGRVKELERVAANHALEIAGFKAAIRTAMWVIPLLVTVGVALANILTKR